MNAWEAEFEAALETQNESGLIDILKSGFPPNFMIRFRDTNGNYLLGHTYPLIMAIEYQLIEVIKSLISLGAQINAIDSYGRSAILVASAVGNEEILRVLVSRRANISARDHYGNTVLHISAANAKLRFIQIYVEELKIPVSVKNKKSQTPIDLCKEKQDKSKNLKEIEDLQEVIEYLWIIQEELKSKHQIHNEKHYGTPQPSVHIRHCRQKSIGNNISGDHLSPISILPEKISRTLKISAPFKTRQTIESYLKTKNAMFKCITAKHNNEERAYFNLSRYKCPGSTFSKDSESPTQSTQSRFPSLGRSALVS
ncbi:unnamed protein product [Blepharisma stoltei]|uniref:Uncharacterized protein n=1 Tax=Blepharisma stoltei TaxID=1481888 RepID=A0AAU9IS27_9CILI|nr:unnamed protein product [Blepharisma stoltei]